MARPPAPVDLRGRRPPPRRTPVGKALLLIEIMLVYARLLPLVRRERVLDELARVRHARRVVPIAGDATVVAAHLGRNVQQVLGRLPTDRRCLIRSLVLLRMLARRDIDAEIVIGVRSSGEVQAHAWVQREGVPLLPQQDFLPLTTL